MSRERMTEENAIGLGEQLVATHGVGRHRLKTEAERESQILEVSIGPQHPSTHGVFRMDVQLDGERTRYRYGFTVPSLIK